VAMFGVAFAALTFAIHTPYLSLPFHWDEIGQFVPAALDLARDGAWVAHSTVPNVHPPAVIAVVALVWRIFGVSIPAAKLAMLAIASFGVLFSFLLAIRLARGSAGAPAFAAVLFLVASPLFYTQSMMVLLDMPAMTLTVLALLLFFDEHYGWCVAVCTLLVLTKETSITTPVVLAAWLWFKGVGSEGARKREAVFFLVPLAALGGWLAVLHHSTGYWLGNAEFAQYNVAAALQPLHVALGLLQRFWFLFVGDGHWIGSVGLFVGWRLLRGGEWAVCGWVAAAQILIVTLLGGAELNRYLLPVLPILYAAFATAASAYPATWRWTSSAVLTLCLLTGWFWNAPYPFPYENNLAMADFVALQRDAAEYLEAFAPRARIASAWPFTDAIARPEFGYVDRPLRAVRSSGLSAADFSALDPNSYDVLVRFSASTPVAVPLQGLLRHFYDVPADDQTPSGFVVFKRLERRGQWIEICLRGGPY
jgi:4-amino-4-deoxy-L-arabinose transferase-like glycosyltransferase